jgi:hypothetical protein
VKPVGEPDAGNRHVRFDERGWETERCRMAQATAPILDSTSTDRQPLRRRGQTAAYNPQWSCRAIARANEAYSFFATNTMEVSLQSVGNLWTPIASDIKGPTDRDWVGLCFETEISRCALDSCMAQERSNCLQIASAFQNVESLRPA